jgi:hypothetical protein
VRIAKGLGVPLIPLKKRKKRKNGSYWFSNNY